MPGERFEMVFVDDGSTDQTVVAIERIQWPRDTRCKVISLARNFGHQNALTAGYEHASGDVIVCLDADLQDPPEMIEDFIKQWEAGYKSVMATKPVSEESSLMFAVRKLYYKTIGRISEVPLVPNATGSGLFDRAVLDILRKLKDPYPYFRGLVCEIGYPIATVPFKQPRRLRGVTSQNFYSLYDMAMLGITKHSKVPLRLMTLLGFGLAMLSLLVATGYFLAKLFFWNSFFLGTAPLVIGLFFFSAVQMIFLGMLGEYIGTIQTQVRDLPLVVELERVNFESGSTRPTGADEPIS
jgi:glycosyltransferase involved in cell wall biosynthesis